MLSTRGYALKPGDQGSGPGLGLRSTVKKLHQFPSPFDPPVHFYIHEEVILTFCAEHSLKYLCSLHHTDSLLTVCYCQICLKPNELNI